MAAAGLQLRPPVRVAFGLLPSAEQELLRICLRTLGPRLPVPCMVSPEAEAEILMLPTDDGRLMLRGAGMELTIERPVRLAPLADALQQLVGRLLAQSGSGATAEPAGTAAAAPVPGPGTAHSPLDAPSLLALLLTRPQRGRSALQVDFESGRSLWVDERYDSAQVAGDPRASLASLGDERIARVQPVDGATWAERTAAAATTPVTVEQLCWAIGPQPGSEALLERWHDRPASRIALHTWPNLSLQADAPVWLSLLAKLSRGSQRMDRFVQLAVERGMPVERARFGASLLLLFRHARLIEHIAPAADAPPPAPTHATQPARAGGGLLQRVRNHFRTLVSK